MKMKKKKTAAPKKSPRPKARPTAAPKKSPRPQARIIVDISPRAEMAASPRDFAKKKKKK